MRSVTLGRAGITVPQNAFGALPIQRIDRQEAVGILRRAYDGGMRYFDTARAYSDSEEKLGYAFEGMRDQVFIATKSAAKTPGAFRKDINTSLRMLRTDYIDVYQFHMVDRCYRPGDGSGMYECMQEAKASGKIRHISVTSHKIEVAMEIADSGLYDTLQFPFSYLSSDKELALVEACRRNNVGFIAMKGLAGGLISESEAAMAYMLQFDNVLPIWGIQKMSELEEWLAFMHNEPEMTDEIKAFIDKEKKELSGEFCRGCGYCMPCTVGIKINNCARMSLMLRRAPSKEWLTTEWREEMAKIEDCLECGLCASRCPYELDTPQLLRRNLADYRKVLAGEAEV